jgi:hypothetical protein
VFFNFFFEDNHKSASIVNSQVLPSDSKSVPVQHRPRDQPGEGLRRRWTPHTFLFCFSPFLGPFWGLWTSLNFERFEPFWPLWPRISLAATLSPPTPVHQNNTEICLEITASAKPPTRVPTNVRRACERQRARCTPPPHAHHTTLSPPHVLHHAFARYLVVMAGFGGVFCICKTPSNMSNCSHLTTLLFRSSSSAFPSPTPPLLFIYHM